MLSVVLSKKTRARAIQLPAWNEALGLPRPWDQQWSLRLQQIMALETDILEYEDIFEGSGVIRNKINSLKKQASKEIKNIMKIPWKIIWIYFSNIFLIKFNSFCF